MWLFDVHVCEMLCCLMMFHDAVLPSVLLHIIHYQLLLCIHLHHFLSSLRLRCLHLTSPPFDRRFQASTRPTSPTHSVVVCRHTTAVCLLHRLSGFTRLLCLPLLWWDFQTSSAVKTLCLVQVSYVQLVLRVSVFMATYDVMFTNTVVVYFWCHRMIAQLNM